MSSSATQRTLAPPLVKLLRPEQWAKNLFLFIAPFFAGEMLHYDLLIRLAVAFVVFSGVASAIYIFNDYRDLESDRKHPKKCRRPLAAGEVTASVALTMMTFLIVGGTDRGLLPGYGLFCGATHLR